MKEIDRVPNSKKGLNPLSNNEFFRELLDWVMQKPGLLSKFNQICGGELQDDAAPEAEATAFRKIIQRLIEDGQNVPERFQQARFNEETGKWEGYIKNMEVRNPFACG